MTLQEGLQGDDPGNGIPWLGWLSWLLWYRRVYGAADR